MIAVIWEESGKHACKKAVKVAISRVVADSCAKVGINFHNRAHFTVTTTISSHFSAAKRGNNMCKERLITNDSEVETTKVSHRSLNW